MVKEAVLGKVLKMLWKFPCQDDPPKKNMFLDWDFLINLEISERKMKIFQSVLKKWSNVQQN